MLGTMAPGGMPGMASLPMQALQPYGGLLPSNMPPLPPQATPPPTMTLDDHGSGWASRHILAILPFVCREQSALACQLDQRQHTVCCMCRLALQGTPARPFHAAQCDRGVGGVDGPIAALLATNYSILDTFKQNMQTWRVSLLCQHLHTLRWHSCVLINSSIFVQAITLQLNLQHSFYCR